MARLDFDISEVDPSTGGGPLPPGEYEFQVIEEAIEANNAGTGEVLKLTYEVLGPEQASRRVWVNLNIVHSNPVAQKIGKEELSALCHAIGKVPIQDTEELLWTPFRAISKIETDKNSGKERAAIKKYLFGDALKAPAEKARPTPPPRPVSAQAGGAVQSARTGAAGNGTASGGRNLPWGAGRGNAGGSQAPAIDDEIPF